MQKKLIAVAVAGALGAPAVALAQASTVQVYGNINVEYDYIDQGAGLKKVDMLQAPGANIGFKGEEKLGGGMAGWFQCESTADPRGENGGGSGGVFCSRNSAVGLKGGFGNFFMGTWDTPMKRTMSPLLVGANETGLWGAAPIVASNSTTVNDNGSRAVFMRRQRNYIGYDLPNFNGFQGMAGIGSTNGATASTAAGQKARVMSLGATYSNGPLLVGAGYEKHNNFGINTGAGAGTFGNDKGWDIGASYTFMGAVKVGGMYTRQSFESTNGLGDVKYKIWHVGVDWNISGPHGLLASYSRVGDADGAPGAAGPGGGRPNVPAAGVANDTSAKFWTVRYRYAFSKRTTFWAGYARVTNDSGAAYAISGAHTPTAGEDQSGFGINLQHRF